MWECRRANTEQPVVSPNPKPETQQRCGPWTGTGRPVIFRNTWMSARIQRESCGRKSLRVRDSHASSFHEPSLELQQRTKITRAPCRRRTCEVVPRANFFRWLDNSRSQSPWWRMWISKWIQSYPCKTKTSQKTERSLLKFLEPKITSTDNSWEFGKACEDLSWNHCTSKTHYSGTNGIAERAVRRIEEGTSAVFLQAGLDENWWADSMRCYCDLRDMQDRLSDVKTTFESRFREPFKGPIIPFGSLVENHPISTEDQWWIHQFGKQVLPGIFFGYVLYAGRIWKETYWFWTLRSWKRWTHQESMLKDSTRKRW